MLGSSKNKFGFVKKKKKTIKDHKAILEKFDRMKKVF